MTKEHSTLPLFHFFDYQGGVNPNGYNRTIHQLAHETWCAVYDLIYLEGDYTHQSYQQGHKWQEYSSSIKNTLAILYRGDVQFWLGVRDTPIQVKAPADIDQIINENLSSLYSVSVDSMVKAFEAVYPEVMPMIDDYIDRGDVKDSPYWNQPPFDPHAVEISQDHIDTWVENMNKRFSKS